MTLMHEPFDDYDFDGDRGAVRGRPPQMREVS